MAWNRRWIWLTATLAIFSLLSSCLDTKPKILGGNKTLDFSSFDSGTQNSFKFNFALKGTSSGSSTMVYLQGSANTKSGMIGTCNLAGTSCVCEFLDSSGNVLETSNSSSISYDERGNYFRCSYSNSSPTKIRIKNLDGSISSADLDISTLITLYQLLGNDLETNRVRSVYRYSCEQVFLQKQGTTTLAFDCSNQATLCDSGNFCLLKARFPFYLYADTYSTNFNRKLSDKLYNETSPDQRICGVQIKQINCADTDGVPIRTFGLYGQATGIWETSVQLPAAPDQPSVSYGFAAKISATTGECPPGLEKRVFFTATLDTSDITPSHNFVSGQVITEVTQPSSTPAPFTISKYGGGSCGGTSCSLPISYAGNAKAPLAFSSAGKTQFCVIPASLLP